MTRHLRNGFSKAVETLLKTNTDEQTSTFYDVQIEEKEDRKQQIFPFIPKNVTPRHQEQIKENLKTKGVKNKFSTFLPNTL